MKVYLAGPIDLVTESGLSIVAEWRESALWWLKLGGHQVYDPSTIIWANGDPEEIWLGNQAALVEADACLALLPPGVRSIGTPMEIEHARMIGKALVVVCEDRSFQLEGAGISQFKRSAMNLAVERLMYELGAREVAEAAVPLNVVRWTGDGEEPMSKLPGDAGFDLYVSEETYIRPGETVNVPHDISVEFPSTMWGMLVPRSSTMRTYGVLVSHAVIDSGYRGKMWSVCTNIGREPVRIAAGARVSQLIPFELVAARTVFERANGLSVTERGLAGFGSTGL